MRIVATLFCSLVIVLQIISLVNAHAVLNSPRPWCPWAARDRPCGYPTMPLNNHTDNAVAVYRAGQKYTFLWDAENGDGLGRVSAVIGRFNTDGTPNFTAATSVTIEQYSLSSPGWHRWNISIPENISCATDLYANCPIQMQAFSGKGWFSCYTARIYCPTCDVPPGCGNYPAKGAMCSKYVQDDNVLIPFGSSISDMEASLNKSYVNGLAKGPFNVSNAICTGAYLNFLCDLTFPPSGVVNDTYSACLQVLQTCGVKANTFCQKYFIEVSSDSSSSEPVKTTAGPSSSGPSTSSKSSNSHIVTAPLLMQLSLLVVLLVVLLL